MLRIWSALGIWDAVGRLTRNDLRRFDRYSAWIFNTEDDTGNWCFRCVVIFWPAAWPEMIWSDLRKCPILRAWLRRSRGSTREPYGKFFVSSWILKMLEKTRGAWDREKFRGSGVVVVVELKWVTMGFLGEVLEKRCEMSFKPNPPVERNQPTAGCGLGRIRKIQAHPYPIPPSSSCCPITTRTPITRPGLAWLKRTPENFHYNTLSALQAQTNSRHHPRKLSNPRQLSIFYNQSSGAPCAKVPGKAWIWIYPELYGAECSLFQNQR